ncbi:MAG TPA: oxidoreductase [Ktedonobacteraceae bacterium]|jgi:NAD(P)-dependent dehydrogenase (short-subunit alcohol dehydrogenase family)
MGENHATQQKERRRKSSNRVWFVTGSSTGFGRILAEAVLARGDRLVATARHPEKLQDLAHRYPDRLLTLQLDVTNEEQSQEAVARTIERFGKIDVLVNNAGYGLIGAIEEASDAEVRRQFETNVFGLLNVTRAVIPVMRGQHRGHILMLSSVGGFTGSIGAGIYNASKFAVEGLSEALVQEVEPLGIRVTLIEPGYFRTDFAGRSLMRARREIADYTHTSGTTRERMMQINGQQMGDPERAVHAMIKIVETAHPPFRLVLGADALARIRSKLASVAQELDAWEDTTLATSFEDHSLRPRD